MAKAQELLERANRFLDAQETRQEVKRRVEAIYTEGAKMVSLWGLKTALEPVAEYRRQAALLLQKYPQPDWSRVDWMIATAMAGSGQYDVRDIERAILGGSPNLQTRKAGHLEDYAHRTAIKAWQDPTAQAQRDRKNQQRDRGREL